jgi:hypothetical protein
MENLKIEPTKSSPDIFFDCENHCLEIKGKSYPANSEEFFEPLFSWLDTYLAESDSRQVTVNIELIYFNSSTSKMLTAFFEKLETAAGTGKIITVNWCYEEDDEDSMEYGEEFQEDFEALSFHLVEKEEIIF